jgi:hypothetical protein
MLFISCKKTPFCKCKYGYNEEKSFSAFPVINGFTTLEEKQTFIVRDEMEYVQLFNPHGKTDLPYIDFSKYFLIGIDLINDDCNYVIKNELVCTKDNVNKLYYYIKQRSSGGWCNLSGFSSLYYNYKAILLDRKYINYEIEIKYDVKR